MTQMQPIRIAGAGPSGLAAAIALAKGGRAVEVHEAKPDVGTRFIGDLQIIEAASESEPIPIFLDRIGIGDDRRDGAPRELQSMDELEEQLDGIVVSGRGALGNVVEQHVELRVFARAPRGGLLEQA